MEQWNNSTAVNCTIFQKCSTPSKVNGRGYLYRRPSLQTLGNAPTCSLTAKNIPGFWAFPGVWSVQIVYSYTITFLMWSDGCLRPSGSSSPHDLPHGSILTGLSSQILGSILVFEGRRRFSSIPVCRCLARAPSEGRLSSGTRREGPSVTFVRAGASPVRSSRMLQKNSQKIGDLLCHPRSTHGRSMTFGSPFSEGSDPQQ